MPQPQAHGYLAFCFSSNIIKLDKYIEVSNSEPTVTLQYTEIYFQKVAQFLNVLEMHIIVSGFKVWDETFPLSLPSEQLACRCDYKHTGAVVAIIRTVLTRYVKSEH